MSGSPESVDENDQSSSSECPTSPEIPYQGFSKTPRVNDSSNVSRRLFVGGEPLKEVSNRHVSGSRSPQTSDNTQLLIMKEVQKANSRLDTFATRLEAMETRLTSVENTNFTCSSSSTGCSSDRAKRKVPAKVRVSSQ